MDQSSVFEACKAELEAAGQLKALRCIQSLETRIQTSKEPVPPPRKKQASFVACTLCRKSKAKCVISRPGVSQCDRCRQAGCECIFEKHKRGRKPTRGLDMPRAAHTEAELSPGSEPRSLHIHPSQPSHSPDFANAEGSTSTPPVLSLLHISEMTNSDDDTDVAEPPITHSAAHPLPFISGSHRPFTIQSMLNPLSPVQGMGGFWRNARPDVSNAMQDTPGTGPVGVLGDPVSRGLVSVEMAQQLYTFFFDKLNPIVMLFDPTLHTFVYVRHKSSFLFSAILSSSAKFVAPELYKGISQLAMEYSLRAILNGRSVETIQGWMIIYFWKAPRDNRAWMYVGLACRMGVELGLDCTPIHDPPYASELDQRERRNRQRTWMLAFMMDRAMASATGRDWMVRGHDAVVRDRLFSDHRLRLPGDAVVGGFTELRLISSEAVDLLYPGVAAASSFPDIDVTRELLRVNYDLKLWLQYWTTEINRFDQPPIYLALLRLFGLHVQLTLNSFAIPQANSVDPSLRGFSEIESQTPEKYCYDLAIQNLKQLRVIHDIDGSILRYMQDSISIMVAYAACFLRKVINNTQFHDDERHGAILLITQTSQIFSEVTSSPLDTANLQAQFLQSLAQISHHMLEGPAPHVSTNEDHPRHNTQHSLNSDDVTAHCGVNAIQPPIAGTHEGFATPQNIAGVDLSHLDGATWDQIMADWIANPDSNSLQYQDFVTNFASSSFVDVQQYGLAEFPDFNYSA